MTVKQLRTVQRSDAPIRISVQTHRELRAVAALRALSTPDAELVTMRSLVDLAWETLKGQRPDLVAQLRRAEALGE